MAALNFPDTPVAGDTYGSDGVIWRWDGSRWAATAGISGSRGSVAYAQILTDQGNFVALADVAGLLVSFPTVTGRRYKVTGNFYSFSSVANDTGVASLKTGPTQLNSCVTILGPAGTSVKNHVEHSFVAGTTGSMTLGLQYGRNGGTGTHTVVARSDYPAFLLVEDVTLDMGVAPPPLGDPAGRIDDYVGTTAPNGWLAMIGQAVSGADLLYPSLWSVVPAGWKSSTTLTLPDTRGRVSVGYNASDTQFDAIGELGGAKTHTLAATEMPVHTHVQNPHNHNYYINIQHGDGTPVPTSESLTSGLTIGGTRRYIDVTQVETAINQNAGSGLAHNNLQPYITFLKIIRAY